MTFKQIVKIIEAAAVAAALVFVIMLFANEGSGGGTSTPVSPGAALYQAKCQSCHGVDGSGGLGPALAGVVTKNYPNIEDQIAFVAAGKGTMPGFEGELTEDELLAVVEYTRTELGG